MFLWKDYTKLAKSLEKYSKRSTISEAFLRSAVSRGYYAIYHASQDYAITKGYKKKSHSALISFLKIQSDSNVKLLGVELDNYRKDRNDCDYEASVVVNSSYIIKVFLRTDSLTALIPTLP